MKNITLTLVAAAFAFTAMAVAADAQSQSYGAKQLKAQIKDAIPIDTIACNGTTGGYGCGPGWIWSRYRHRCVPC